MIVDLPLNITLLLICCILILFKLYIDRKNFKMSLNKKFSEELITLDHDIGEIYKRAVMYYSIDGMNIHKSNTTISSDILDLITNIKINLKNKYKHYTFFDKEFLSDLSDFLNIFEPLYKLNSMDTFYEDFCKDILDKTLNRELMLYTSLHNLIRKELGRTIYELQTNR